MVDLNSILTVTCYDYELCRHRDVLRSFCEFGDDICAVQSTADKDEVDANSYKKLPRSAIGKRQAMCIAVIKYGRSTSSVEALTLVLDRVGAEKTE